jgi:hypothetical protein
MRKARKKGRKDVDHSTTTTTNEFIQLYQKLKKGKK